MKQIFQKYNLYKKRKLVGTSYVFLGKFETPLVKYGIPCVNNMSMLLKTTDITFVIETEGEKLRDSEATMVKMILGLLLKKLDDKNEINSI